MNLSITALILASIMMLTGCMTPQAAPETDIQLTIEPAMEISLADHKILAATGSVIAGADVIVDSMHKGDFGRVKSRVQQQAFKITSDGKFSSTAIGRDTSPNGSEAEWVTNTVSVCGLLTVLEEVSSSSNSQITTAFPAGRLFVPLAIGSSSKGAYRSRVTAFEASVKNVCAPAAGSRFSIQFSREEQRRYEGRMLSSNRISKNSGTLSCSVGESAIPASGLNSSLPGRYLSVSCTESRPDIKPRSSEFAFLLDLGVYLPLSEQQSDWQAISMRYTGVRLQ